MTKDTTPTPIPTSPAPALKDTASYIPPVLTHSPYFDNQKEETDFLIGQARESLLSFCQAVDNRYLANWHHEVIAKKLEQAFINVQAGKKTRIILAVPPRHGKSELATIKFPAWALGRDPNLPVIVTSYSADLAEDFGLKTRDLIRDQAYRKIFPTRLRVDTRAKGRWLVSTATAKGEIENAHGSYTAVGVGGAITGRGARIAVIDDPLKNREEANSETYRQKVWDWYTSTLYTRLEGFGAVIIIMTRWHMDDLVGRVLEHAEKKKAAGEAYDDWEVIEFPAIAEVDEYFEGELLRKEGEALWENKFPLPVLENIKSQSLMDWAALYQQTPILAETQEFKPGYFKYFEEEDVQNVYMNFTTTVDPAGSKKSTSKRKSDPDNSVICTVGKEVGGPRIFHMRMDAGRFNPKETIDLIFKHQVEYNSEVFVETIAYQETLKWHIEEEQRKKGRYFVVEELKGRTSKEMKIKGLLPLYIRGVMYHRKSDFKLEEELLQFPHGKHDDRADALAMQLEAMQNTRAGNGARQFKKKHVGYFRRK